jgi:hypothetical protein
MRPGKLMLFVLCVCLALILVNSGFAEEQEQEEGLGTNAPESFQVTVSGQILYNESEGGYFIQGDGPNVKFRIANQNPEILKPLLNSRNKEVQLEGRFATGMTILFIEKIEGKPYQATPK